MLVVPIVILIGIVATVVLLIGETWERSRGKGER